MSWRSRVGNGLRGVVVVLAGLAVAGGALAAGSEAGEAGATGDGPAGGDRVGTRVPLPQQPFTIEEVLAPAYPRDLVAARDAERIAWIAYEAGLRNVYTAAAPDFEPVRLTDYLRDDGVDLTDLRISDDGSVVVYIRGHDPNREGWVANPSSDPRGAERAVWAVETGGGEPWKVVVAGDPALSPNGRWVLFERDGQIWRAPVDPRLAGTGAEPGGGAGAEVEGPLFRAWGENEDPVWSPDGNRIAFVSDRETHSFIGVYDLEELEVGYLAPGVDHDDSPTFSPDGSRIAFIRRPGASFGRQVSGGGGFAGFSGQLQTVGLVQLLRAHGVPHELIVFPDEVHDFLVHERWLISFRAMDGFFDRHLWPEITQ